MMALRISIIINIVSFIIICLLLFAETIKKKRENFKKCRSNSIMWFSKVHAAVSLEQLDVLNGLIEKDIQYFKTVLPVEKVDREFQYIADAIRVKAMAFK